MTYLKVKRLSNKATLPARATPGSVGFDIAACLQENIVIMPGETHLIKTGFSIALEPYYAAFIYSRSGLGVKRGIVLSQCVGVVDSDYRGEVVVPLKNTSNTPFEVKNSDRIAQMVITKCELPTPIVVEELDETERGEAGFGSTGV